MSSSAIVFGQTDVSLQGAVGFKNRIINGNFDIWQRGTSQTTDGFGSDDRWSNSNGGSTKTHSRQAFSIGQTDVTGNSIYFSRTVVTSVAGASNAVTKRQTIENVRTFAGQTATLSFWAKADASKNIALEFIQNFGTGGSPSTRVTSIGVTTFQLTTSWKKFNVTVTIPSILGKTLGSNNDDSLEVVFWFDAGSSFNSRTNSLGQQSGTFDIAQVQLEAGTIATPFENRPVGAELSLCQRYYQQAGGTISRTWNLSAATANVPFTAYFKTTMRATPSSVTAVYNISDGTNTTITSANFVSPDHFCRADIQVGTNQFINFVSYTASAEL